MKNSVLIIISLLFLVSPLHAEKKIFQVKVENLNIRAKPTMKSKIIGHLTHGDYIFTNSNEIIKNWVPVKTENGRKGYVHINYLTDVTPHGFSDTVTFYLNYFVEKYLIATILVLILLGIILGLTKTVVIYKDYSDVVICAALLVIPLGALLLWSKIMLIFQSNLGNNIFLWALIIFEVLLFLYIVVSTYRENGGSIIKTFLSLITKIPLTLLFTLMLLDLITPREKGKSSDKRDTIIILAILTPLIYGLVRHKVWIYKGESDEEIAKELKDGGEEKILKPKV